MNWFVLSMAAAEAVSQVLVIVACGVILSKTGYLSQTTQKSISKLNLYFLTPCLLFTKIASSINWTQFVAYWPIPVFYVFFSFASWIVAKLGSKLLGFSNNEQKFVIASVLFSNTNTLPLALLQSLAFSAAAGRLMRDSGDTSEAAAARGISYVLFYAIFGNLIRWSYGFSLLVPKEKKEAAEASPESDALISVNVDPMHSSEPSSSAAGPSHLSVPEGARSPSSVSVKSASSESAIIKVATTAYDRVKQVMTPPLVTAVIALIVGLVPFLHQLLMSPKSNVYRFLIRPIENCGSTAIPMILLCLGAQVIYFVPSFTKSSKAAGKSHTHPKRIAVPSVSAGLVIYSDQDDLSYGQGIASTRSNASSAATLLHFKDADPSNADRTRQNPRIARYGSTSSVSPVTSDASDDDDDEAAPLLKTQDEDDISNYRVRWITPVPFILFSRMFLVPMICLPFIIFHPIHMSPVLTTDPMFTLAMILTMAAPTAINLIQQCAIKGFFEQEMAMVLFWSYCVFGIPCILAWSLIGLWAAGRK
ncbi:membrane transport protein-domain-containing protein [Mortierella sp. GBAus27b]|nr:membrane transport protein-domain-containing protein [Mortierella sp. GBAus27b]